MVIWQAPMQWQTYEWGAINNISTTQNTQVGEVAQNAYEVNNNMQGATQDNDIGEELIPGQTLSILDTITDTFSGMLASTKDIITQERDIIDGRQDQEISSHDQDIERLTEENKMLANAVKELQENIIGDFDKEFDGGLPSAWSVDNPNDWKFISWS